MGDSRFCWRTPSEGHMDMLSTWAQEESCCSFGCEHEFPTFISCFPACVLLGQLMSKAKPSQALNLLPTTSRQSKSGHKARTQTAAVCHGHLCVGGLSAKPFKTKCVNRHRKHLGPGPKHVVQVPVGRVQIHDGYFDSKIKANWASSMVWIGCTLFSN